MDEALSLKTIVPPLFPAGRRERELADRLLTENADLRQLLNWAAGQLETGDQKYLVGLASSIFVRWNHRFTSVSACATPGKLKIELSAKIWPHLDPLKRREVVVHEACHIFSYWKYVDRPIEVHGVEWSGMMGECGYPDASWTLIVPDSVKRKEYTVYCRCGEHRVTPQLVSRMRRYAVLQKGYFCPFCNFPVRRVPYEK